MLEGVLASVLNKVLGSYVDNLETNQLKIGIWKGDVKLQNLRLRKDALDSLHLPIDVVEGNIGSLVLTIPWANLKGQPMKMEIEDVTMVCKLRFNKKITDEQEKEEIIREQAQKMKELSDMELLLDQSYLKGIQKEEDTSYAGQIITMIIDNLQITIKNIHLRYEDSDSNSERRFSAGIVLSSLSIVSTNDQWVPMYLTNTSDSTHKQLNLDNFYIYWDDKKNHPVNESEADIESLDNNITFDSTLHNAILSPISGTGRLIINKRPEKGKGKIELLLNFDQFAVSLSEFQFQDALLLMTNYEYFTRKKKYRKYLPNRDIPVIENAREWLIFSIKSVLAEVKERRERWSWSNIKEKCIMRRSYIALYTSLKTDNQLNSDELATIENLEKTLSLQEIKLFRSLALPQIKKYKLKMYHKKKLRNTAQNGISPQTQNKTGWVSGWVNWAAGTGNQKNEADESMITDEELNELYEALELEHSKNNNYDLMSEVNMITAKASLGKGLLELKKVVDGKEYSLISAIGSNVQAEMLKISDNITIDLVIEDFIVNDNTISNTKFPQMIKMRKQILSESEDAHPFMHVKFELNPIDGHADSVVQINAQSLDIVFHPTVVREVQRFFKPPLESVSSAQALVEAASRSVAGLQSQTRAGLQHSLETHKRLDLKIDFQAPIFIFPIDVCDTNSGITILDLGHLTVSSELVNSELVKSTLETKKQLTDSQVSELESLMYDWLSVKLEKTQLVTGQDLTSCTNALLGIKTSSKLHVIDRIELNFRFGMCILSDRPIHMPQIILDGHLPTLQVFFSDAKYTKLMSTVDIIVSAFGDNDDKQDYTEKSPALSHNNISFYEKAKALVNTPEKDLTPSGIQKSSELQKLTENTASESFKTTKIPQVGNVSKPEIYRAGHRLSFGNNGTIGTSLLSSFNNHYKINQSEQSFYDKSMAELDENSDSDSDQFFDTIEGSDTEDEAIGSKENNKPQGTVKKVTGDDILNPKPSAKVVNPEQEVLQLRFAVDKLNVALYESNKNGDGDETQLANAVVSGFLLNVVNREMDMCVNVIIHEITIEDLITKNHNSPGSSNIPTQSKYILYSNTIKPTVNLPDTPEKPQDNLITVVYKRTQPENPLFQQNSDTVGQTVDIDISSIHLVVIRNKNNAEAQNNGTVLDKSIDSHNIPNIGNSNTGNGLETNNNPESTEKNGEVSNADDKSTLGDEASPTRETSESKSELLDGLDTNKDLDSKSSVDSWLTESLETIKVNVKLKGINLYLCDDYGNPIALLALTQGTTSLTLSKQISLETKIGGISLIDKFGLENTDVEDNTTQRRIMYIKGKELLYLKYQSYDKSNSSYPGYDNLIDLNVGALHLMVAKNPIKRIIEFSKRFAIMHELFEIAQKNMAEGASQITETVVQGSVKTKLNIVMSAPVINFLEDGRMSYEMHKTGDDDRFDFIVAKLGELSVTNTFETVSETKQSVVDVNNFSINLNSVNIYSRFNHYNPKTRLYQEQRLDILEDITFLSDVKLVVGLKNEQTILPDTKVVSSISQMKMKLTNKQYKFIMDVLQIISDTFGSNPNSDSDSNGFGLDQGFTFNELDYTSHSHEIISDSLENKSNILQNQEKVKKESTKNERRYSGIPATKGQLPRPPLLDIILTLPKIQLELYECDIDSLVDLKQATFVRMDLDNISAKYRLKANGASIAELSLGTIYCCDTRPNSKSCFTQLVAPQNRTNTKFGGKFNSNNFKDFGFDSTKSSRNSPRLMSPGISDLTGGFSLNTESPQLLVHLDMKPDELTVVRATLDSPIIIVALDHVFQLFNFFQSPFNQDDSTDGSLASESDQETSAPEEKTQENVGMVINANIIKPELIMVANPKSRSSEALIVSVREVCLTTGSHVGSTIDEINIVLCQMDKRQSSSRSIMDPVSIVAQLKTDVLPFDVSSGMGSSVMVDGLIEVGELVFRVGFRDINLIKKVVNEFNTLMAKANSIDSSTQRNTANQNKKEADISTSEPRHTYKSPSDGNSDLVDLNNHDPKNNQNELVRRNSSILKRSESRKSSTRNTGSNKYNFTSDQSRNNQRLSSSVESDYTNTGKAVTQLLSENANIVVGGIRVVAIHDKLDVPFLNIMLNKFNIKVSDWSSELYLYSEMMIQMSFFDFHNSHWEPIIESWPFFFDIKRESLDLTLERTSDFIKSVDEKVTKVDVGSNQRLEINAAHASINALLNLLSSMEYQEENESDIDSEVLSENEDEITRVLNGPSVGFPDTDDVSQDKLSPKKLRNKPGMLGLSEATPEISDRSTKNLSEAIVTRKGARHPYLLTNKTGLDCHVWIDLPEGAKSSKNDVLVPVLLKNNTTIPWNFENWRKLRDSLESHSNQLGVQFSNGMWEWVRRISVDREGTSQFTLVPEVDGINYQLAVKVSLDDDLFVKHVTLQSTLVVENRTLLPIELCMCDYVGTMRSEVMVVQPNETFPLPLLSCHQYAFKVRPESAFGYSWSERAIFWRDFLVENPQRIASCFPENALSKNVSAFNFNFTPNFDKNNPLSFQYPNMHLVISSPLEIENLLPYNIQFRIYDKTGNCDWSSVLPSGEVSSVHSVKPNHLVLMSIRIQDAKFDRCDGAVIESHDTDDYPVDTELIVHDSSGAKLTLKLIRTSIGYTNGTCSRISIVSPYIIINRTGMPLTVKSKTLLRGSSEVAGQQSVQEQTMILTQAETRSEKLSDLKKKKVINDAINISLDSKDGPKRKSGAKDASDISDLIFQDEYQDSMFVGNSLRPLMFSYGGYDIRNRVILQAGFSEWSKPLSLDTVGYKAEIVIPSKSKPSGEQNSMFLGSLLKNTETNPNCNVHLGIQITPGVGRFSNTRFVEITPRYVVKNNCGLPLLVQEVGTLEYINLDPGQRKPLQYLPNNQKPSLLLAIDVTSVYKILESFGAQVRTQQVEYEGETQSWSAPILTYQLGKVYIRLPKPQALASYEALPPLDNDNNDNSDGLRKLHSVPIELTTVLLSVDVIMENACIFVVINRETGEWPYRIDNWTGLDITFWQDNPRNLDSEGMPIVRPENPTTSRKSLTQRGDNLGKSRRSSTRHSIFNFGNRDDGDIIPQNKRYTVIGNHSMPYAWDNPEIDNKMLCLVICGQLRKVSLLEIGMRPPLIVNTKQNSNKANDVEDRLCLIIEVAAQGSQQVLRVIESNRIESMSLGRNLTPNNEQRFKKGISSSGSAGSPDVSGTSKIQNTSAFQTTDFVAMSIGNEQSRPPSIAAGNSSMTEFPTNNSSSNDSDIALFVLQVKLEGGIGISLISRDVEEIMYASFSGLEFKIQDSPLSQAISLQIQWIQVDNQLYGALYPIVLYPTVISSASGAPISGSNGNSSGGNQSNSMSKPAFQAAVVWSKNDSNDIYSTSYETSPEDSDSALNHIKYLSVLLQELSVELDEDFLMALLDYSIFSSHPSKNEKSKSTSKNEGQQLSQLQNQRKAYATALKSISENFIKNGGVFSYKLYEDYPGMEVDINEITSNIANTFKMTGSIPNTNRKNDDSTDFYFDIFILQPIKLNISFLRTERVTQPGEKDVSRSSLTTNKSTYFNPVEFAVNIFTMAIGNVNEVPIYFNALILENARISGGGLSGRLSKFYQNEFMSQIFRFVGSADVLGNPVGLFNNISSGFVDIFYEPYYGLMMSERPHDIGLGFAKGAASFFKKTVYGVSDSMSRFTDSVGKGLSAATMDSDFQKNRRIARSRNRPRHAIMGVTQGAESFAKSVTSGITGVVMQPLAGAEKDGFGGFFMGVGKGLVGVVTKPLVGLLDLTSNVTEGIRNNTSIFDSFELDRQRLPRFVNKQKILEHYSSKHALGLCWMRELGGGKFAYDDYLAHLELENSDLVVLLTYQHLIMFKRNKTSKTFMGTKSNVLSEASITSATIEWEVELRNLHSVILETSGISCRLPKNTRNRANISTIRKSNKNSPEIASAGQSQVIRPTDTLGNVVKKTTISNNGDVSSGLFIPIPDQTDKKWFYGKIKEAVKALAN
ncbi:hypothetical protein BB559_000513 [Furculomyces boomerangus]|uniref:Vacuolar protein sorting-associated protein n=1 Tax=Furculomyces boomerangus TaxID=61424 RepID=A0A2T9Z4W7_9FUNG|nr:hypothetical protein BB559_000513 [Furculomyces boomerangus]